MINIDDFKTFFYNVANKSGRGTLSPAQFNSFVKQGLMAYYNKKMEATNGGIAISTVEVSQKNIEDLNTIKEERKLLSNLGSVLIPDGTTYDLSGNISPEMWHFGYLTFDYYRKNNKTGQTTWTEKTIEVVKDNEWGKRTGSPIVAPSMQRPIASFSGKILKVRPKIITNVNLVYYRYPETPKWGYTLQNNRPLYDSVSSTDIEAPKEAFNEIAMLTLNFLGIKLREQDLVQYAGLNEGKGI